MKIRILWYLLSLFQLVNCQDMKKENVPMYYVQISHPRNEYLVTPIQDKILTLEGIRAGLPYGSTSGSWGYSGKSFTEQFGTPIGVDIVYYARYEDTFYHLKADFPVEKMKELVHRAYATGESESYNGAIKEFIDVREEQDYNKKYNLYGVSYEEFRWLIFGFAPKGMVVVWLGYGPVKIELGRFQAEVVKEDKKYSEIFFTQKSAQTREEIIRNEKLSNISPEEWDNYRIRYSWFPLVSSEHKGFRLFQVNTEYYNAEYETMLQPWVSSPSMKERAVPEMIQFFWETGKGEAYEGRVFFNWEEMNEMLKNAGNNSKLEIKIRPDNRDYDIFLNDQLIQPKSKRLYSSSFTFKNSYENR